MNLLQHVINIRQKIQRAFDGKLERLGIEADKFAERDNLSADQQKILARLQNITISHIEENKGDYSDARENTLNQCVFTLFNRLAAIKLMENKEIIPEVIRQRADYGGKSQSHLGWIEEHPEGRSFEREGLVEFFAYQFDELSNSLPLYKEDYPYALMPTADELSDIIKAFNAIDDDPETSDAWKGHDILGWLYENFNSAEKIKFKESGEKTEYHKVSLQSQVYTPDWVVKFLVDNTLGKLYLEMFPDSTLALPDNNGNYRYPIANRPSEKARRPKDMRNIRLIDPACGSGNFLLYAFDVLYDMYVNQIEQYGKQYDVKKIAKLIVEHNIYGVDLDERAVQLAQVALMIKASEKISKRNRRKKEFMPCHTNIVSTNFFLPNTEEVQNYLTDNPDWNDLQKSTVKEIWSDLCQAYKFGTLVRVEEKLEAIEPNHDELSLFSANDINDVFHIKNMATGIIREQVNKWGAAGSNAFTLTKANDAVSFLEILSHKFDVVVANPPYTDSGDFGPELKAFVEANYKVPIQENRRRVIYKFNSNLYACFIKRCCELAGDDGKVGMIHPMTFMYIKSFEDVRKYMLNNTRINLFVEYGLSNLFGTVMVDPAFYTLDMNNKQEGESIFISLDQYTRTPEEKNKKRYCLEALNDICNSHNNKHVYTLPQSKLKGIKSYPFIYWISDEFREKFEKYNLEKECRVISGFKTGKNEGALRLWWEVNSKAWAPYTKGGTFNKWYGNNWLKINTSNDYEYIKSQNSYNIPSVTFKEGITYNGSGSKGVTFRLLESDTLYDMGACSLFPNNTYLMLGLLNSKLMMYSTDCLNPTVNVQPSDIHRLPFFAINNTNQTYCDIIEAKSQQNVLIKKALCKYSLIEPLFESSPIIEDKECYSCISDFYNFENALLTQVLLNESLINKSVFSIYRIQGGDLQMVLEKKGIPVGDLPVSPEAKAAYKEWLATNTEFPASEEVLALLEALEEKTDIPRVDDFDTLYTNNKEWEEFCIQHNMNPVEVWYQFKNAKVLPPQRTQMLAFELLTDVIRTILAKDDDGIVPLTARTGEETLLPRIQAELIERGYNNAQIAQIFSLVCNNCRGGIQGYLNDLFFQQLGNHLNLFMYLPKTPFIWHITSGEHRAIDLYISIYKWTRDTVMRIKSVYVANRESALNDRLQVLLQGDATQKAEAVVVKEQLTELKVFTEKLDSLLAAGYNPKLDDGVGKNIAPLQKAGLLRCEVLKTTNGRKSQLNKYLNADW